MGAKITPRYWLLITILCTFPRYLYAADDWGDDAWGEEEKQGTAIHGFIETAVGDRVSDDTLVDDELSLAEVRARLEAETYQGALRLSGKVDLYADGVERGFDIYLREAVAEFSLTDNVDVRAGHQVLTWGTGDLLFLNDLSYYTCSVMKTYISAHDEPLFLVMKVVEIKGEGITIDP